MQNNQRKAMFANMNAQRPTTTRVSPFAVNIVTSKFKNRFGENEYQAIGQLEDGQGNQVYNKKKGYAIGSIKTGKTVKEARDEARKDLLKQTKDSM